jgi:hypothetical protein
MFDQSSRLKEDEKEFHILFKHGARNMDTWVTRGGQSNLHETP